MRFIPLTLFALVFLFVSLGSAPLIDWDENIYAEASRQMVERGDYLNIYINNHPFAEKPPFFFWEQSLSYHLFGVNEFAARFPTAIAGLLTVWLCFAFGTRVASSQFGLLWGMIYLTSFLPGLFSRSAVIDHTFNFFIALATFALYSYDVSYGRSQARYKNTSRSYALWLTLASVAMGLGVLTKGPLGGVIPLVAFGTYKIFYRKPSISILHFIYCGVLSLAVATSWYVVNAMVHGIQFIEGFIEFQLLLFSKPLEGHVGPFYFHFAVAIVGLAPWTAFLWMGRPSMIPSQHEHFRPMFIMGAGWVTFVLILFSLVTTKLPHYSASIYIPLSFIVALGLFQAIQTRKSISWLWIGVFVVLGGGLAAFQLIFPMVVKWYSEQQSLLLNLAVSPFIYVTGGGMLLSLLIAAFLFARRSIEIACWITAIAMLLSSQGLWRFQIPVYLQYIQQPMLELVKEAHAEKGKLVFYRYVSFAALFYGKQPIEMLHTYKFPGDPEVLNSRGENNIFVVTEVKHKKRLQDEHPLVEHRKDAGGFTMYVIPKEETVIPKEETVIPKEETVIPEEKQE